MSDLSASGDAAWRLMARPPMRNGWARLRAEVGSLTPSSEQCEIPNTIQSGRLYCLAFKLSDDMGCAPKIASPLVYIYICIKGTLRVPYIGLLSPLPSSFLCFSTDASRSLGLWIIHGRRRGNCNDAGATCNAAVGDRGLCQMDAQCGCLGHV